MLKLKDWMVEHGEYEGYALILSDFDPFRAKQILDNCSYVEIAEAIVAKRLFNKVEK